MSLLLEEKHTTQRVRQRLPIEVKPSRKAIVARPGCMASVNLYIDSPYRLNPRLAVEDLDLNVARSTITPVNGETPFTARLELAIGPEAVGIYPFRVVAQDVLNNGYGAEKLVLIILPPELPVEVVNHLRTILILYKTQGIQHVVWYLLLYLFKDRGMSFTELKAVYELLKNKQLSNGTVGDLIERMEKKGILAKRGGRYYARVEDENLVLQAIDAKRVKAGRRGAKRLLERLREGCSMKEGAVSKESIPLTVRRVLREAEKLIDQGRRNEALGLLQHTLVGVRKSGRWVLWIRDIFIYRERKAKPPFHYFRSEKLAGILKAMRLKQGFIHVEPVHDLIHRMFPGGYREARRIHYLIKSIGWLSYGEPLILYMAVYSNGTSGFKLENLNKETLIAVNYKPQKAMKIVRSLVMPSEHVDQDNDKTYFRYR